MIKKEKNLYDAFQHNKEHMRMTHFTLFFPLSLYRLLLDDDNTTKMIDYVITRSQKINTHREKIHSSRENTEELHHHHKESFSSSFF